MAEAGGVHQYGNIFLGFRGGVVSTCSIHARHYAVLSARRAARQACSSIEVVLCLTRQMLDLHATTEPRCIEDCLIRVYMEA